MIFLSIYKTVLQYRTLTVYFLVKVSKYIKYFWDD